MNQASAPNTANKIYVTTDTHFGHKALYEKHNRPEGFESVILGNIAKKKGAILIHCGDFAWKQDVPWHESFMHAAAGFGKKILVRGNHDYQSNTWYLEHGWDFVCDRFDIKLFGKKLIFTHIPFAGVTEADFNIHGHLHGQTGLHRYAEVEAFYNPKFHIDVAPDDNQYRPYDLEELLLSKVL